MNKVIYTVLFMLLCLSIQSCNLPEYKYKCKIYYLDGSIDTIVYCGCSEPYIWSNRDDGCYLNIGGDYIRGVDRVDILNKKIIKTK